MHYPSSVIGVTVYLCRDNMVVGDVGGPLSITHLINFSVSGTDVYIE